MLPSCSLRRVPTLIRRTKKGTLRYNSHRIRRYVLTLPGIFKLKLVQIKKFILQSAEREGIDMRVPEPLRSPKLEAPPASLEPRGIVQRYQEL